LMPVAVDSPAILMTTSQTCRRRGTTVDLAV
jgi:hypothetical protein